MSLNKTDIVNTLCIAHQITKYEPPPEDCFIVLTYKTKSSLASIVIQVSRKVINCVSSQQRTLVEINIGQPPVGGWDMIPTPMTWLKIMHQFFGEYNSMSGTLNPSKVDIDG